MRLLTKALAATTLATLSLSLLAAPANAATFRDPLTKNVHLTYYKAANVKIDIEPLAGKTVTRFGKKVAANYDVKVISKQKVLFERHLGYWHTTALDIWAQDPSLKTTAKVVARVKKIASEPVATSKKRTSNYVLSAEHAMVKSDVRNTVSNVVVALASSSNPDLNAALQDVIDHQSDYVVLSTDERGGATSITISKVNSPAANDPYPEFKVVGTLPSDGYTFTFDSYTGTFHEDL